MFWYQVVIFLHRRALVAMLGSHAERSLPDCHLSFDSKWRVVRTARHHFSLMSAAASPYLPCLSLSQQRVSTDCGGLCHYWTLFSPQDILFCECLELLLANLLCLLNSLDRRWIRNLFALLSESVMAVIFVLCKTGTFRHRQTEDGLLISDANQTNTTTNIARIKNVV